MWFFRKLLLRFWLACANRANSLNDVQDRSSRNYNPELCNVSTKNMMRSSGGLRNEEATGAAWEAGRGAVAGAARVSISLLVHQDQY